jgi:hypothetical protein
MTTKRPALPHDAYITAVCDALTAAGLHLTDLCWTDDCETRGTYCYLNAVITLDPERTTDLDPDDVPAGTAWPHGLILVWEWHTGIEADQGEPDRGPQWLFAAVEGDGRNAYPTSLPVHGYASPAAVLDAARKVIAGEIGPGHFHNGGVPTWDGGTITGTWENADQLDAACTAWGDAEAAADPATAPPAHHGPDAARRVAEDIATTSAPSYVSIDGETERVHGPAR